MLAKRLIHSLVGRNEAFVVMNELSSLRKDDEYKLEEKVILRMYCIYKTKVFEVIYGKEHAQ